MPRGFRAPAPRSRPALSRALRARRSSARPASLLFAMATPAGAHGAPLAALAEGTPTAIASGCRSLDSGVRSGAAIASADLAFSLDVVKANHPFGPAMFGKVEAVETPDDLTAVFKLSEPAPGLLLSLQPLLMPILLRHVLGDGREVKKHPRNMTGVVGTGPFRVEENNPAAKLILVKKEDFSIEGRPKLDRTVLPRVKDGLTRMPLGDKGEIDHAPCSGAKPAGAEYHRVSLATQHEGLENLDRGR